MNFGRFAIIQRQMWPLVIVQPDRFTNRSLRVFMVNKKVIKTRFVLYNPIHSFSQAVAALPQLGESHLP